MSDDPLEQAVAVRSNIGREVARRFGREPAGNLVWLLKEYSDRVVLLWAGIISPKSFLYRHYDADGGLLYVGISNNVGKRLKDHEMRAAWFGQVARIEIEPFPDRRSAMNAEMVAIVKERPRYNKQGSIRDPSDPEAVCIPEVKDVPAENVQKLALYERKRAVALAIVREAAALIADPVDHTPEDVSALNSWGSPAYPSDYNASKFSVWGAVARSCGRKFKDFGEWSCAEMDRHAKECGRKHLGVVNAMGHRAALDALAWLTCRIETASYDDLEMWRSIR